MTRIQRWTAFMLGLPAVAARACTVCGSSNGQQLRAGLFNGHFLQTALLVGAPVPVFAAVLLLLHVGMPDLEAEEQARPGPLAASFEATT